MGKPVRNPLTGELYADGIVPQSAITSFARQVLAGLPAPTRAGVSNNFDSLPRRQDYNDKFDIKVDQQFNAATTAFIRFSNRDVDNFEPPPIPGETSSPSNAYVDILNQQVAGGVTRTLGLTSLLEVRVGVSRTKAGKTALGTGSPNMFEAYGITGPSDRHGVCRRPDAAVRERLDGVGPAEQQPAVPGSARHRRARQLLVDSRPSYAQGRLRVPAHQYRHRRRAPEVRRRRLQRSVQPARPERRPTPRPSTSSTSWSARATRTSSSTPSSFELRQRMHFGYVQDDWRRVAEPDVQPRSAVRVRDAAVGEQQLPDELRSGDERRSLQANDGSIYDRALVNPDRTTSRHGSAWPTASRRRR